MENPTGIKPLYNRIIVKRYEKEIRVFMPKKEVLIHIPTEAREGSLKASQGEIVAIGDTVEHLKPGDKVTWGKYAGVDIKHKSGSYVMMNDDDLLGVLDKGYLDD